MINLQDGYYPNWLFLPQTNGAFPLPGMSRYGSPGFPVCTVPSTWDFCLVPPRAVPMQKM